MDYCNATLKIIIPKVLNNYEKVFDNNYKIKIIKS